MLATQKTRLDTHLRADGVIRAVGTEEVPVHSLPSLTSYNVIIWIAYFLKRAKYPLAVLSGYSRRLKQDLGWRLFVFFY